MTTLTYECYQELQLPLSKPSKVLVGADGSLLNCVGEICDSVLFSKKDLSVCGDVFVVKGAARNLLSLRHAIALDFIVLVNEVSKERFDPFIEYPELFEGLGTMPDMFYIDLVPDAKPYRLYTPRSIPVGLRERAKEKIDQMLEMGVIEPVEEPTDWCFGLTIAPKSNGDIRMCVDLTQLNKSVKREIYPLPRVSDMLAMLSEGKIFSKIDCTSGFWQVKLDPASKLLTTFITPWGRFCHTVMPFGITSAPEVYQRSMEKIVKGLKGVICLMDDVLIFAADSDTHWKRVRAVLCRLKEAGVTLNKKKCEFGQTAVKFLGHLISHKGVEPDPDKVKAIVEMNPPTCAKEAKRFMGMVNYLGKFSGKLAELSIPIYSVMGKGDWFWGDQQQRSFEKVKSEMTSVPVLCTFDLNAAHRVSADSSRWALGAVLLQRNSSNEWQPVEYASRKLTSAETRYAMIELESLAVTWACEKYDFYLVGRNFEIETDHKPLVTLLGEKDLSLLPLRVQRFKLRMMRYSYTIFHTPGKYMYIADALSRPVGSVSSDVGDKCKEQCDAVETFVAATISEICNDVRDDELINALRSDAVSIECVSYIINGWPNSGSSFTGEMAKLYANRDRLTVYGDMVMFDSRIYIPFNLRDKYLSFCHEGHQGIEKCRRRARQLFWWPGLSVEIEDYVKRCNMCIRNSAVKHEPCKFTPLPEGPWVEIGSDLMVFKHKLYIVIVDYYTKWIECSEIPSQTSRVVIEAMKAVFSRLGVPKIVRSDNGPCYASLEFRQFADQWGFKTITSSPRYPPSNGMAEKAVDIVKRLWRKCDDKEAALLAYRSTPLSAGFSPSELMFGRITRSKMGTPKGDPVDYSVFEALESESISERSAKWDLKYRAKPLPVLTPGHKVWVKAPTDIGCEGLVLEADKLPNSFWVRVGDRTIRRNRKHLFLLNNESPDCSDEDSLPFELCDDQIVSQNTTHARLPTTPSASSTFLSHSSPTTPTVSQSFNHSPISVGDIVFNSDCDSEPINASENRTTNLLSASGCSDLGLSNLFKEAPVKCVKKAIRAQPASDCERVSSFGRQIKSTKNPDCVYY